MVEFDDIDANEWSYKIVRNHVPPRARGVPKYTAYDLEQKARELLDLLDKLKITKR